MVALNSTTGAGNYTPTAKVRNTARVLSLWPASTSSREPTAKVRSQASAPWSALTALSTSVSGRAGSNMAVALRSTNKTTFTRASGRKVRRAAMV